MIAEGGGGGERVKWCPVVLLLSLDDLENTPRPAPYRAVDAEKIKLIKKSAGADQVAVRAF